VLISAKKKVEEAIFGILKLGPFLNASGTTSDLMMG